MKVFAYFAVLALCSCMTESRYRVVESIPERISRDSLRVSVVTVSAQPIVHAGKVLSYNGYLYVNEPYKGWHIIDNTVPAVPRNIGFISAPGSLDAEIIRNYLYLNNSVDLVCLDLSNPQKPNVLRRIEDILSLPAAPRKPWLQGDDSRPIIGWHDSTVIEVRFSGGSFA